MMQHRRFTRKRLYGDIGQIVKIQKGRRGIKSVMNLLTFSTAWRLNKAHRPDRKCWGTERKSSNSHGADYVVWLLLVIRLLCSLSFLWFNNLTFDVDWWRWTLNRRFPLWWRNKYRTKDIQKGHWDISRLIKMYVKYHYYLSCPRWHRLLVNSTESRRSYTGLNTCLKIKPINVYDPSALVAWAG